MKPLVPSPNFGIVGGTANPGFVNCRFHGNSASDVGGAVWNVGGDFPAASNPTFTNCTYTGNYAQNSGRALYNQHQGNPSFTNCILWGDNSEIFDQPGNGVVMVTYSIVQGGFTGMGNLSADPLFITPAGTPPSATGNLRLQEYSPATEAGDDAANNTTTDLDGNPRKIDAIHLGAQIDMGAYEFQGDLDVDNDTYPYCYATDCDDNDPLEFPGQIWYKDADGDDYSDGVSQVSCLRPTNYFVAAELTATSGDCDDNDLLEFPGQIWYKDVDGDDYSDGVSQVSCLRPANYFVAAELTATSGDCNDNCAACYPGAPEICDGMDNDCNGNPESAANTWTGGGDGMNWSDPTNWSDGFVPLPCQDVVIPNGFTVTVMAGFNAVGRTLDVPLGAVLTVNSTATLDITN